MLLSMFRYILISIAATCSKIFPVMNGNILSEIIFCFFFGVALCLEFFDKKCLDYRSKTPANNIGFFTLVGSVYYSIKNTLIERYSFLLYHVE